MPLSLSRKKVIIVGYGKENSLQEVNIVGMILHYSLDTILGLCKYRILIKSLPLYIS